MSLHENQIASGLKRAGRDRLLEAPRDSSVRSRKLAMGFAHHAGQCGSCRFFLRTPIGEQNQCLLGKFHCASKHGCVLHQPGPPAVLNSPVHNIKTFPSIAFPLAAYPPGLIRRKTAVGEE
jgi:hypothetical protein